MGASDMPLYRTTRAERNELEEAMERWHRIYEFIESFYEIFPELVQHYDPARETDGIMPRHYNTADNSPQTNEIVDDIQPRPNDIGDQPVNNPNNAGPKEENRSPAEQPVHDQDD